MLIPLINPLNNVLLSNAVLGFISPHGITDYIHAKKHGLKKELYQINIFTVGSTLLIEYFHNEDVITFAFLLASIIHFRNDMPYIELKKIHPKVLQLFFSFCMIESFFFLPVSFFVAYMLLIHTPNHYKMSWEYTKYHLQESILLIVGLGILLLQLDNPLFSGISIDLNVVEAFVIGHIIYQEAYVFPECNQIIRQNSIKETEE
jgi:hypothetical protein